MFDKIVYIGDRVCDVKLKENADITFNLMNLHIIFEDKDKKILGEVDDISKDIVKVRLLGEITDKGLLGGVIRKPTLDASIRVISPKEIPLITGKNRRGYMLFGKSPFYNDKEVFMNVNGFFSNHFAIFGNSGSGKSCGVSRIFQNMFQDQRLFPYKSNILMFDSSGEYYNAFRNLSTINPNYNYRFITTNESEGLGEALRIPIYLLNVDDLALLLNVTSHSQLPIIERMLKLARIFSEKGVDSNSYKNHLIAKAIMTILYTNETSPNKRNEIFSIIASCSTPEFNLETELKGIGYTRKFRDCFLIDQFGNFTESVLMTEYVSSFIKDEYDSYEPSGNVFYTLDTLEKALNFTLISEGWLRNENTYGDSVTIKVRLHSLITGNNAKFFDYKEYVSLEQFISSLLIVNGRKFQLVNINLDDVDDTFAKVIVKVYSRLIFTFAKSLGDRASIPFHLIVEEAHRYIQNDTDTFLIGYNIFDRIAKEGRKYGVILGLITQRPVEMSDTVISQCSNFLIFKMNHPADVEYIRKMVPNISEEIVEKQKSLQAGTCLAFGQAFKIPLIVKMEMPNPEPRSGNCDVVRIWDGNQGNYQDDEDEESDDEDASELESEKEEASKEESVSSPVDLGSENKNVDNTDSVNNESNNVESTLKNNVTPVDAEDDEDEEEVDEDDEDTEEDEINEEDNESSSDDQIQIPKFVEQSTNVSPFNNSLSNNIVNNNPTNDVAIPLFKDEKPNLMEAVSPVAEVDVNNKQVDNVVDTTSSIPDLGGSADLENNELNQIVNGTDNNQTQSIIPDVDVFVPNMAPPENSTNVSLNQQFASNQSAIIPDVKQEVEKPAVIIPGGQNVSNALLEGFGGKAVTEDEIKG
mgnify:CR=1 FL=1